jgi:plasmid stability protein
MPAQLTIRGVSDELNRRLSDQARADGKSVNALALSILEAAVGIDERRLRLNRYMTWSANDRAEFDSALRAQRGIDHDLWR